MDNHKLFYGVGHATAFSRMVLFRTRGYYIKNGMKRCRIGEAIALPNITVL